MTSGTERCRATDDPSAKPDTGSADGMNAPLDIENQRPWKDFETVRAANAMIRKQKPI